MVVGGVARKLLGLTCVRQDSQTLVGEWNEKARADRVNPGQSPAYEMMGPEL